MGALLTFVLSGLIHELVITVPAGAGYGLPTLYFTLQGLGLMLERKVAAPVSAWLTRLFAWALVLLPIAALFPPIFVERVMVPFFHILHAL
jgi:alginate O-acetyltransferase complex protein AlgI